MSGFLNLITEGGWAAYLIVSLGVAGTVIAIQKAYFLFVTENMNTQMFTDRILEKIHGHKGTEALGISSAHSTKSIARIFHSILERSKRSDEAILQAQEIALTREIPNIQDKTNYLSLIANVSTLVGLLGTVQGLIMSFSAVASADPTKKQELLAQGISVAMNTTALGLMVAIPMMILFVVLSNKQNRLTLDIYEKTGKLTEALISGHLQALESKPIYPGQVVPPSVDQRAI